MEFSPACSRWIVSLIRYFAPGRSPTVLFSDLDHSKLGRPNLEKYAAKNQVRYFTGGRVFPERDLATYFRGRFGLCVVDGAGVG